jgi:hypothetical protein
MEGLNTEGKQNVGTEGMIGGKETCLQEGKD